MHTFSTVLPAKEIHEIVKKCLGKCINEFLRIFCYQQQLTLMRLGHQMTFKTVLISTLLLTHLAIPAKLL